VSGAKARAGGALSLPHGLSAVANAQYAIEARRGEKSSGMRAILLVNFGRVAVAVQEAAAVNVSPPFACARDGAPVKITQSPKRQINK
jgi:hypothetical protein